MLGASESLVAGPSIRFKKMVYRWDTCWKNQNGPNIPFASTNGGLCHLDGDGGSSGFRHHQKNSKFTEEDPIPSICLVLCFIGLMLPPGWHHYFAFLPFAQLMLLQYRPPNRP